MLVSCGHSFGGLMLRKVIETVSGSKDVSLGVLSPFSCVIVKPETSVTCVSLVF